MMDTAMVRDQVGFLLFQIIVRLEKPLNGRKQLIQNQIFYITTILSQDKLNGNVPRKWDLLLREPVGMDEELLEMIW